MKVFNKTLCTASAHGIQTSKISQKVGIFAAPLLLVATAL